MEQQSYIPSSRGTTPSSSENTGPAAPASSVPEIVPEEYRPQPEQTFLSWEAPNRPFKKRNRQFYITIAIIVFLVGLILVFAGQLIVLAVAISAMFLVYVLNSIPPEIIQNQITTYGVRNDQQLYHWEEMGRFWFDQKHGQKILHIEVTRFPGHLTIMLGDQNEQDLIELLSQVLLQEKPLPTTFDKAAAWLQKNIPLDTES